MPHRQWTDRDIEKRIRQDGLDEVLEQFKEQLQGLGDNTQAALLENKKQSLLRARILDVVSEIPIYDAEVIIQKMLPYLCDALGSEVVNFNEYLGFMHPDRAELAEMRRHSDKVIEGGRYFRNQFGTFRNQVFEDAVKNGSLITTSVSDEEKSQKRKYNTKSFMVSPLYVRGRAIGLFSLADKFDHADYGLLDREEVGNFMSTLGHCLTDKLQKARDGLTDVFNSQYFRNALLGMLSAANRTGAPLSLFYSDLDDFKKVNDTYGHAVGDRVLKEFADILKTCVRYDRNDEDLIGRLGGEEFCLALPLDEEQAIKRAEILLERVQNHDFYKVGKMTVSVGVFTYFRDGSLETDVETVVDKADKAMYHKKQNGKDGFFVYNRSHLDNSRS